MAPGRTTYPNPHASGQGPLSGGRYKYPEKWEDTDPAATVVRSYGPSMVCSACGEREQCWEPTTGYQRPAAFTL